MHPVCSFRANEVHISSAMPHSMPKAVKREMYTMQRMELRRTLGSHCSRVAAETAEVGLLN